MTYIELRTQLLAEIDTFLSRTGMTETGFGIAVLNDPAWVGRLRQGMDPRIGTVDKCRLYMLAYKSPKRPRLRAPARAYA